MAIGYRSVLASGGGGLVLDSLVITTPATTTNFIQGESLDTTGLVVTGTLGNMTGDVTSECTITPQVLNTAGTQAITIAYGGLTATYNVTVEAFVSIAITTPPTKTSYKPNEQLDLTGIVVTGYSANLTRDVTSSCTFSPADGTTLTTEGTFTLTATFDGHTATTSYKVASLTLVSWSTGTDQEIQAMVDAYYAGDCTLADIQSVWSVGDERTVNLSDMAATGVGESHVAQSVTMVIMNFGGKKLSNDHTTDVLAVVGQKNSLTETGYMNSANDNTGGWNACARRTWCNSVYKAAIPSDFRALFKEFDNVTANGTGSTPVTSADYFAMASEKEVFGSATYADATAEAANSRFSYYVTAANRIKTLGDSGSANDWWERSPRSSDATRFCGVNSNGNANSGTASITRGLAPFGCI